jgi:hypothetical protein
VERGSGEAGDGDDTMSILTTMVAMLKSYVHCLVKSRRNEPMKEPEINLQTAGRLILNHLYDHPIEEISSNNLVNVITPET